MLNLKVSGISEVTRELEAALNDIDHRKARILRRTVDALKDATPVDTGNARDHWKVERGAIVNEVDYLSELNHGHSNQAPALFVEKTILESVDVKPNGIIVTYK